jgi:hypothetical protein
VRRRGGVEDHRRDAEDLRVESLHLRQPLGDEADPHSLGDARDDVAFAMPERMLVGGEERLPDRVSIPAADQEHAWQPGEGG